MSNSDNRGILEKAHQSRRDIISIVLLAFTLGLLVNLLSAAISNFNNFTQIIVYVGLSGLCLFVGVYALYSDRLVGEKDLGLLLIIEQTGNDIEIKKIDQYPFSNNLNGLYSDLLKSDSTLKARIIADWKKIMVRDRQTDNIAWRILYDLIEYNLLSFLAEFGRKTLTMESIFSPYRSFLNELETQHIEIDKISGPTAQNPYVHLPSTKQKIILPKGFTLSSQRWPKYWRNDQFPERIVSLKSPHGIMEFHILSEWASFKGDSRTSRILERLLKPNSLKNIKLLRFPLRITVRQNLEFQSIRGFLKMSDIHFNWLQELYDALDDWNWQNIIDAESNRLIVKIYRHLEKMSEADNAE